MSHDRIEQIEAMRMGVDYSFPVRLRNFTITLRPLSNSEMMQSYSAVAQFMSTIPQSSRTKIHEDNALAREFLKSASSPPDFYAPKLTDPILDKMTNDEIMYFYREWQSACDRVNPALERMPIEKLKELVESVKKNPPKDLDSQLIELSFGQLVSLASYLLLKDD